MASEWTDEQREAVVSEYKKAEPTPETSMDIVAELADKYDKSPNGVRMLLTRAGVYVKKTPEKRPAKSNGGNKRVNKAEAIAALDKAIEDAGKEVDTDITSRLTGKAAVYFTELLSG